MSDIAESSGATLLLVYVTTASHPSPEVFLAPQELNRLLTEAWQLPNRKARKGAKKRPALSAEKLRVLRGQTEGFLSVLEVLASIQAAATLDEVKDGTPEAARVLEDMQWQLEMAQSAVTTLAGVAPRLFRRLLVDSLPELVERYDKAHTGALASVCLWRDMLAFLLEDESAEVERQLRPADLPPMAPAPAVTFDLG